MFAAQLILEFLKPGNAASQLLVFPPSPCKNYYRCAFLGNEESSSLPANLTNHMKLFQAKELVDDIREAFEQNILELDWMDEKTKSLAIQKVTTDDCFRLHVKSVLFNNIT